MQRIESTARYLGLRGHDAKAGSMKLTTRYRLPAIYPFRFFAEVGGLMSSR